MPEIDWSSIEVALKWRTMLDMHAAMPSVRALVALAAKAPCQDPQWTQSTIGGPTGTAYCGKCDSCRANELNRRLG